MTPEEYNYPHFDAFVASGGADAMFARFQDVLHAGTQAPDGTLTRLSDGAEARLSELWASKPVVLEFGSFT